VFALASESEEGDAQYTESHGHLLKLMCIFVKGDYLEGCSV